MDLPIDRTGSSCSDNSLIDFVLHTSDAIQSSTNKNVGLSVPCFIATRRQNIKIYAGSRNRFDLRALRTHPGVGGVGGAPNACTAPSAMH